MDYHSGPYTVTFPAGITSIPFSIPINDDSILEYSENFMLTINESLPRDVTVGNASEATVTIIDDDSKFSDNVLYTLFLAAITHFKLINISNTLLSQF